MCSALGDALVVEDDVTLFAETPQDDVAALDRTVFLRTEAVELDREDGAVAKATSAPYLRASYIVRTSPSVGSGLALRGRAGPQRYEVGELEAHSRAQRQLLRPDRAAEATANRG